MAATTDLAPSSELASDAMPEVRALALDRVRPPSANVRVDLADLDGLVASIRANGVLSAVTVRPLEDGTFEIVAGARRREAAIRAGLRCLPAIVRSDLDEPVATLTAQLAENVARLDLPDSDVVAGVQQMLDLGASDEQVATTGAVALDDAQRLRAVLGLGELVRERIAAGTMSIADATAFTPLAGDGEYLERALLRLDRGWRPQDAVRDILEQRRTDQQVAAGLAKLETKGVRVVDQPGHQDHARVRALGTGYGQIPLAARTHAKLPCHAAYVDRHARRGDGIVYVCTHPAIHAAPCDTLGGNGQPAAESAGTKAAETRAQRKAWRATHADRFAFTTSLLRELDLDEVMRRVAEQVMPRGEFGEEEAAAIAVQLLTGEQLGEGRPATARARLKELAADSGEGAVRAAAALLAGRAELAFLRPEGDHRQSGNVAAHFRLMLAHEYPMSAAEVWQLERGFQIRSLAEPPRPGAPLAEVLVSAADLPRGEDAEPVDDDDAHDAGDVGPGDVDEVDTD